MRPVLTFALAACIGAGLAPAPAAAQSTPPDTARAGAAGSPGDTTRADAGQHDVLRAGAAGDTLHSGAPGAGIPALDTLAAPAGNSVDHRAFRYVYGYSGPAFTGTMREVNALSRPIFLAAVPVSGVVSLAVGADLDPTARLAASQVGATGAVYALKFLVRRPRPYVAFPDVESRVGVPAREADPFSLPSGHAAMSFAMATSTTLSYPHWYVGAPAYLWAGVTSLSRIWHGVHFPSDVLIGAAMGTGVGVLVHVLMPEFDDDASEALAPAPVVFRFSI